MKPFHTCIFVSTLLFAAACAPAQPWLVTDTIGPLPSPAAARPTGSLIVYTETERPGADPTDYAPHSDYRLYSMDGSLLRWVTNRNAPMGRAPATVELPIGHYKVVAAAPGAGLLNIPVVINQSQTTLVDLINEVFPPPSKQGPDLDTGHWVRLPSGQIIGSKAE